MPFKMGHGGTLDPLATGILIVGIGRGTKHLGEFLDCTKTYETVVIFGKATDTYDIVGKVVAEAPHAHIKRELVEEKLVQFRGKIKQVPPIYSALKINGMKAYEYARSGKELPRQLESRDMEVSECEIIEWFDPGEHDYRWPAEEAPADDREAASKLLKASAPPSTSRPDERSEEQTNSTTETTQTIQPPSPARSTITQPPSSAPPAPSIPPSKSQAHTHAVGALSSLPCPSPAATIRLTVSSGFYVRSFAHDLGRALGSYGIMASLCRSRQANFHLSQHPSFQKADPDALEDQNLSEALPYTDLALGEEIWAPKITAVLTRWMDEHPSPVAGEAASSTRTPSRSFDGRGDRQRHSHNHDRRGANADRRPHQQHDRGSRIQERGHFSGDRQRNDAAREDRPKRRRNSSSSG